MAFKMKGWNAGHGTGSHSALKKGTSPRVQHAQANNPDAVKYDKEGNPTIERHEGMQKRAAFHQEFTWEMALKNDPNLSKLVAERDKHEKGTEEYATAQNRINKAYENAKRHNQKTTTETKTNPITGTKKTFETTVTPGLGTETKITKLDKAGNIIKEKVDTDHSDYVEETYDVEDSRTKQKRGQDKEFGTDDDKTKKKKNWRDTKVGQFLSGKNRKNKKNKKNNKNNEEGEGNEDKKGDVFSRRAKY
jgi:hypothetical protein